MTEPTAFQHWITDPVWNAAVGWVVGKAGDALLGRAKAKHAEWTAETDAQARAYLEDPALEIAFRAALLDAYAEIAHEYPGDHYPGLFTEPFFRMGEPGGEEVIKLLRRDGGRDGANAPDVRRFTLGWAARPGISDKLAVNGIPTATALVISSAFFDAVQRSLQKGDVFSPFFDEQVFEQLPGRLNALRDQMQFGHGKIQDQLAMHTRKLDELLRLAQAWAKAPPPTQIPDVQVMGDLVARDKIVINNYVYSQDKAQDRDLHIEYLRNLRSQKWMTVSDLSGRRRPLHDVYVTLPTNFDMRMRVVERTVIDWWVEQPARNESSDGGQITGKAERPEPPRSREIPSLSLTGLDLASIAAGSQAWLRDEPASTEPAEPDALPEAEDVDITLAAEDLAALAPRLILLGAPGSGKSSFARHFVLLHAFGMRQSMDDALSADEARALRGFRAHPGFRPRTPVYIQLRQLVAESQEFQDPKQRPGIGALKAHIREVVLKDGHRDFFPVLERLLARDQVVLIFDGLDEVDSAAEDFRRNQICDFVTAVCDAYKGPVLITSRPNAYKNDWKIDHFPVAELVDLAESDQVALARRLLDRVDAHVTRADDANTPARLFMQNLESVNVNLELRANPLFLTLLAQLWRIDPARGLPESRHQLYRDTLDHLLERWTAEKLDDGHTLEVETGLSKQLLRRVLERVALQVHGTHAPERNTTEFRTGMLFDEIILQAKAGGIAARSIKPYEAVLYLSQHSGILREDTPPIVSFWHRSYQEHLAACDLLHTGNRTPPGETHLKELVARARQQPELWRNVLSHALDKLQADGHMPALWRVLRTLTEGGVDASLEHAQAAVQALENGERLALLHAERTDDVDPDWPYLQRLRNAAEKIMRDTRLSAAERATAGRAAARIGDTRPEATTLKGLFDALVTIPAGAFQMGSADSDESAYGWEKPLHLQTIKTVFRLARFPVTNAQYRAFVEAGGYTDARWWAHAGESWQAQNGYKGRYENEFRKGPAEYGEPIGLETHPVVGVSWHEAVAFTQWLTEHARAAQWITPHEQVRLPSEAEWERACRGNQDARVTPWDGPPDPQRGNYRDSGIGTTSAVGCFPNGATAEGCEDMIGNVLEWTLTEWTDNYDNYAKAEDNAVDASGRMRVLRGGSWDYDHQGARAAYRLSDDQYGRYDDLGFRVVCASVPHPSVI